MNDLVQQQERFNEDTLIATKDDYNVYLASEFINNTKPISTIMLPNAQEPLQFYQTRYTLADIEKYKAFLDNCIRRFRKSRAYKGYKAYLMSLGLDRCQVNGNIQDGMADIEMHHNFLTIFDITILISQHILNTVGRCTTFDIISLLIQEHRENNIPIVMLSKTAHQLYHENQDFYIPMSMTFGQWWNLLLKYRYGITLDIAQKVVKYIESCQANNELTEMEFFRLSNDIKSWGDYNEYNYYYGNPGQLIDYSGNSYVDANILQCVSLEQAGEENEGSDSGIGQIVSEEEVYGTASANPVGGSDQPSAFGVAGVQY